MQIGENELQKLIDESSNIFFFVLYVITSIFILFSTISCIVNFELSTRVTKVSPFKHSSNNIIFESLTSSGCADCIE